MFNWLYRECIRVCRDHHPEVFGGTLSLCPLGVSRDLGIVEEIICLNKD